MLTYFQGIIIPEMSMAVHQTASSCTKPKLSHDQAIKQLGRYLLHKKIDGIVYNPEITKGFKCYVDTDFAGAWKKADAIHAENVMSRTEMLLMYAKLPIFWRITLQTEIVLSTAESEYIALSSSLREVLPLTKIMEEINKVFPLFTKKPSSFARSMKTTSPTLKWLLGFNFPQKPNTLYSNTTTSYLMLNLDVWKSTIHPQMSNWQI